MKSPAFQWYVNDFLGSGKVAAMSLEEVGSYTLLLNYDWNEVGLPDELAPFPRWLKVTPKKAQALWDAVKPNFTLRDGRWYNPRLEKERSRQEEWRAKSARGGRASAEARWHSGDEGGDKGGVRVVTECSSPSGNTTSSSTSSSTDNSIVARRGKLDPTPTETRIFSHYAVRHPRRGPPDDADVKLVRKALLSFNEEQLVHAIDGNWEDEWHRARRKHELSYVFRNNGKISEFIDKYFQLNAVVVQNGQLNAEGMRALA